MTRREKWAGAVRGGLRRSALEHEQQIAGFDDRSHADEGIRDEEIPHESRRILAAYGCSSISIGRQTSGSLWKSS